MINIVLSLVSVATENKKKYQG